MEKLRVVFLGSDPIALPLLERLAKNSEVEIVAVYTQPDRAIGRGQQVQPNEIKKWAANRSLPVEQPAQLTTEVEDTLQKFAPDLSVVMAYGHILRDRFIAIPRLGTVNLHTSILPKYRGASPIQTAIAYGETETGVSLMRIVRELDAGPVATVGRVAIALTDTAADVEQKLAVASADILAANLPAMAAGELNFVSQDNRAATFCRRLKKEDGVLDFRVSAAALAARIRGLYPWPGCVVNAGDIVLKIGMATVESAGGEASIQPPGCILSAGETGIRIATGEEILVFTKLQRPGGKMLPAADFLRGFKIEVGSVLPSVAMPELLRRV